MANSWTMCPVAVDTVVSAHRAAVWPRVDRGSNNDERKKALGLSAEGCFCLSWWDFVCIQRACSLQASRSWAMPAKWRQPVNDQNAYKRQARRNELLHVPA
jgi:hypothetical protein